MIAYNNGNRNNNKIALTFDDGPNPFYTKKVLDVLDEYNVKANFFILGKWAEKYRDIVKQTFDKGHLIGNHSYSHPKEGEGDFEKAEKIISDIIGGHTKFIRPPYNKVELCKNYESAIKGEVRIINNDVTPCDWKSKAEDIKQRVIQNTKNGSIILLHDSSQRTEEQQNRPSEMFKVLPEIIEILQSKEFDIVRLDSIGFF